MTSFSALFWNLSGRSEELHGRPQIVHLPQSIQKRSFPSQIVRRNKNYITIRLDTFICNRYYYINLPQWPRGLRRRSAAARLLRLWVRIPPGAWMSVCCKCCVFSCRVLCHGPITLPEESYQI